jgi:chromosome partitioning protein
VSRANERPHLCSPFDLLDGIDLAAAAPFLFSAEFALPSMQMSNPSARFWNVLSSGLELLRSMYDVIIIDTPLRFRM